RDFHVTGVQTCALPIYKPVVIGIGRFGPYVLHDKKYVSIPKDLDPYTIPLEKAVELIENKRIADANKLIKAFPENPDIQVLNGRSEERRVGKEGKCDWT